MTKVKVYPLLKAYEWNAKPLAVYENFGGIDTPPMPLVAYCYDHEDNYQIITRQAAEKNGWSVEAIQRHAQKSIDAYPAEWEEVHGIFLTSSGQDFSAEKLLCKDFLLEAHEKLQAEEILVSAPRRTVLYATRADLDDEAMTQFTHVVAYTLADDSFGNQFISPMLFKYQAGELSGAMVVEYQSSE